MSPANDRTAGKENNTPATDVQAAISVIGRRNPGPGRVDLARASIRGAALHEAHLEGADLFDSDLERSVPWRAHLERASLILAHLKRANLYQAHLEGAVLMGASLQGAHLDGAYLGGANLLGTHVENTDLSMAEGLTQTQIDQAIGDAATRLPAALTRPARWTKPAGDGPCMSDLAHRGLPQHPERPTLTDTAGNRGEHKHGVGGQHDSPHRGDC